jgi:hypothetical protein
MTGPLLDHDGCGMPDGQRAKCDGRPPIDVLYDALIGEGFAGDAVAAYERERRAEDRAHVLIGIMLYPDRPRESLLWRAFAERFDKMLPQWQLEWSECSRRGLICEDAAHCWRVASSDIERRVGMHMLTAPPGSWAGPQIHVQEFAEAQQLLERLGLDQSSPASA